MQPCYNNYYNYIITIIIIIRHNLPDAHVTCKLVKIRLKYFDFVVSDINEICSDFRLCFKIFRNLLLNWINFDIVQNILTAFHLLNLSHNELAAIWIWLKIPSSFWESPARALKSEFANIWKKPQQPLTTTCIFYACSLRGRWSKNGQGFSFRQLVRFANLVPRYETYEAWVRGCRSATACHAGYVN